MTIEYKGLKIEVENGDVEINGDTITFKGKENRVIHEHHYHYDHEQVHYPWWQQSTPLTYPTITGTTSFTPTFKALFNTKNEPYCGCDNCVTANS